MNTFIQKFFIPRRGVANGFHFVALVGAFVVGAFSFIALYGGVIPSVAVAHAISGSTISGTIPTVTVSDLKPHIGETITYSFDVEALAGNVATLTDVAIATDTLPSGLTFISSTGTDFGTFSGPWHASSTSFTVTAMVNANATGTITYIPANIEYVDGSCDLNSLAYSVGGVAASSSVQTSNSDCDVASLAIIGNLPQIIITPPFAPLSITKSVNPTSAIEGSTTTVKYAITVTNNSTSTTSTNVVVDDLLPSGITFVSSTPSSSYNATSGVWTVGNLAAGASSTLAITAKVDSDATTTITNLATVFASTTDSNASNTASASITLKQPTSTPSADLSISKTVSPSSTTTENVSSTVDYTITVTNNSTTTTATDVVATDTLPTELTFENATASASTSYASSTGTWTIGTLAPSSTATLDIAAMVNSDASSTLWNTATVSASTTDSDMSNNSSSVSIDVASTSIPTATIVAAKIICPSLSDLPDLSGTGADITSSTAANFIAANPECHLASGWTFQWGNASVSDPNAGGDFIGSAASSTGWNTFGPTDSNGQATVEVANPTSTPNFWVREDLQSGYVPYSYYPGNEVNSTSSAEMFCHVDVLNYDDYDRVDSPAAGGIYYCIAWNVSSLPSADLSINKAVDNSNPSVGNTVNYTITVANLSSSTTSTDVVATDTLPTGLTFENATASASTSYASSTGTWTIGTLAPSSTATLDIAAMVNSDASSTLWNTATVSASTTDSDMSNNSSSVSIDVAGGGGCSGSCGATDADIAISKIADVTSTLIGDPINYTIVVTNLSSSTTSTDVVATDTLPTGLTFENATASASTSYASSTGTWTIGALAPNATATLQLATLVTGPGISTGGSTNSTITNTATVTESSTLTDTDLSNNSSSVSVLIGPAPTPTDDDLAVTKTVDNANPAAGATVNFTVTVTDNSSVTSTQVEANDQLPPGLAYVSATTSQGSYDMTTGDWNIGTISPNATATLLMAAEVDPNATGGTTITNTATVTSTLASLIDSNPANNSSSVTLTVPSSGCTSNCGGGGGGGGGSVYTDMSITKTVDNSSPATGATIHYTLTAKDTGQNATFGVAADDVLPSGLTFVSATTSEGSYDSSTGMWTIGALNAGQAVTLTITATVTAAGGTAITNTATVSETPTIVDPLASDNSSSVTINVAGGGGGGGGGGTTGGVGTTGGGEVLGTSTSTGQVLGASCGLYLTSYIHPDRQNLNDPAQVTKLQTFLNMNLGLNLPVTGYYGSETIAAVDQFQVKYHIEVLKPWLSLGLPTQFTPTSYVYQTTQRWINLIMCPALNIPVPQLVVDQGGE
jgi:uncharacterized repeat protein (TIGR01451 family)